MERGQKPPQKSKTTFLWESIRGSTVGHGGGRPPSKQRIKKLAFESTFRPAGLSSPRKKKEKKARFLRRMPTSLQQPTNQPLNKVVHFIKPPPRPLCARRKAVPFVLSSSSRDMRETRVSECNSTSYFENCRGEEEGESAPLPPYSSCVVFESGI